MRNVLLLIDVLKIYTTPGSPLFIEGHDAAIANMNRLVHAAERRGDLLVCVRHVHRRDGSDAGRMFDYLGFPGEIGFVEGSEEVDFDPRLMQAPGALHLTKSRYSAFVGTGLHEILQREGIGRIVVTGFMTDYCCLLLRNHRAPRARPGLFRGFRNRCDRLSRCIRRDQTVFDQGRHFGGADRRLRTRHDDRRLSWRRMIHPPSTCAY